MNESRPMYDKTFLALLIAVSLAFAWILEPFGNAVFWGAILAIIFGPMHRRVAARLPGRPNLSALISLALISLLAILPLALIAGALLREIALIYQGVLSGNLDLGMYFQRMMHALPESARDLLKYLDIDDGAIRQKLTAAALQASRALAPRALSIGQDTLAFLVSFGIMMYLLFFLLRDGTRLSRRMLRAVPLYSEHRELLFRKFTTVVRATVKGNVTVAAAQGCLGGLIFWALGVQAPLLWGTVMAFLSLLPAVGAGLIWAPVAVYSLAVGAVWQGVTLILFGVLVIGMVDNVLRPVLVGKDTKLPDYVVLISTLGGMSLFGLNGFVIGPLIAALFFACWDSFTLSRE